MWVEDTILYPPSLNKAMDIFPFWVVGPSIIIRNEFSKVEVDIFSRILVWVVIKKKEEGEEGALRRGSIQSEQEELREVRDVTYLCLFVGTNLEREYI